MSSGKHELDKLNEMYYKKYYCPVCDLYHLHVAGNTLNTISAECPSSFEISEEQMIKVIEEDDFKGHFTGEELSNKYYT